jgi:hypothetical protein
MPDPRYQPAMNAIAQAMASQDKTALQHAWLSMAEAQLQSQHPNEARQSFHLAVKSAGEPSQPLAKLAHQLATESVRLEKTNPERFQAIKSLYTQLFEAFPEAPNRWEVLAQLRIQYAELAQKVDVLDISLYQYLYALELLSRIKAGNPSFSRHVSACHQRIAQLCETLGLRENAQLFYQHSGLK